MKTYSNPIAYAKRAMVTDVDACTVVGVANTTLYNGTLVTLGKMDSGLTTDMGYVYEVTPTTADTDVDVWMVISPEINRQVETNVLIDPRAFEIAPGRPADLIRPMAGTDNIHVSIDAFAENFDPETITGAKYATADADGKLKAVVSAAGVTGIAFSVERAELIPVGHEMVKGYVIKCVQNPTPALV